MNHFWILVVFLVSLEVITSKNIVKRSCCNNSCVQQCQQTCQPSCNNYNSNCNNCQMNCVSNCRSNCESNNNCNYNNNNCNNNNCNNNNNNNCNSNNCRNAQSTCENCEELIEDEVIEKQVPVLIPIPPPAQQQSAPLITPTIISNNTNNYTAEINIENVIHTVNNVSVPISVNSSNINHITLYPASNDKVVVEESKQNIESNCCIVIHPKECNNSGKCYSRSSWECSEICQGTIVQAEKEIEVTGSPRPTLPPTTPAPAPVQLFNCSTQQIVYYPPAYAPNLPCQTYVNGVRTYCKCPQQQQANQPIIQSVTQPVLQPFLQPNPQPIPQPVYIRQPVQVMQQQVRLPIPVIQQEIRQPQPFPQQVVYRQQLVGSQPIQQVQPVIQAVPQVQYQVVQQAPVQYQQMPTNFLSWYQQYQQQSPCQSASVYPYSPCGSSQVQSCPGCYRCNGEWNLQECQSSPGCSSFCQTPISNCIPFVKAFRQISISMCKSIN